MTNRALSTLSVVAALVLGYLALTVPRQMTRIETMIEDESNGEVVRFRGDGWEFELAHDPAWSEEEFHARAIDGALRAQAARREVDKR